MAEPLPTNRTADDLVRWVRSAPDARRRTERIARLSQDYRDSREMFGIFNRLAVLADGPKLVLELIARMPEPIPPGLLVLSAPHLALKNVSPKLRVVAAAKLIESLPDKPESVGPILRALTANQSKRAKLERLTQLQSRVTQSQVVDDWHAEAEATTKLRCPRCGIKRTRPKLIAHLWKQHKLTYLPRGVREADPMIEDAVAEFVSHREPAALDHIYDLTHVLYPAAEPRQIHQALLTRLGPEHPDSEPLCQLAQEADAGVCPACYTNVPVPVPPVPPPLALGHGRLFGEGYTLVATRDTLELSYPKGKPDSIRDATGGATPRQWGSWLATGVVAVGLLLLAVVPRTTVHPVLATLVFSLGAMGAYAYCVTRRTTTLDETTRLIDSAWNDLALRVGRSPTALRFLVRLCRVSLNRGRHEERTVAVRDLHEQAAVLAEKGPLPTQLFAAVRLLQAHDYHRIGREWVTQLAKVFEPFWQGQVSAAFADAVAVCLQDSSILSDRDAARLRVVLPEAAFENGTRAIGLACLAEECPSVGQLLGGTVEWFDLLYEVWRTQEQKPWRSAGQAQTVFEFARNSPNASGVTLLDFPDTLLVAELDSPFDQIFGAVLIGRRGVTLGDLTTSDPEAEIRGETLRNGTHVLIFGTHRIVIERKATERLIKQLRLWLRYRVEKLMPAAGRSIGLEMPATMRQALQVYQAECPHCRTRSRIRRGELGVKG